MKNNKKGDFGFWGFQESPGGGGPLPPPQTLNSQSIRNPFWNSISQHFYLWETAFASGLPCRFNLGKTTEALSSFWPSACCSSYDEDNRGLAKAKISISLDPLIPAWSTGTRDLLCPSFSRFVLISHQQSRSRSSYKRRWLSVKAAFPSDLAMGSDGDGQSAEWQVQRRPPVCCLFLLHICVQIDRIDLL